MSYKKLDIYNKAHSLANDIHQMTLKLPKIEKFEEGQQIRRSAKSVSSNIVEGFSQRNYKNQFLKFLYHAYGSCEETKEHLEFLYENGSLKDKNIFDKFFKDYEELSRMIYSFIKSVEEMHLSKK